MIRLKQIGTCERVTTWSYGEFTLLEYHYKKKEFVLIIQADGAWYGAVYPETGKKLMDRVVKYIIMMEKGE